MGFTFNTRTAEEMSKVTGRKQKNGKSVIDVQSAKYGMYYDCLKGYVKTDGTLKMGDGASIILETKDEARKVKLNFTVVSKAMVPVLPLYWRASTNPLEIIFELREKKVGKKTGKRTPKA